MIILETQRLLLRHPRMTDLDDLFSFYSDPAICQYIPDAPRNYQETQAELEWHLHGHPKHPELGLWATVYKETDQFIGRCGLLPWIIDGYNEVEVAYALSTAYWGRGLGTEVAQAIVDYGFETLKLSRLVCLIDQENMASIKVAEKVGMIFEKEGRDEIGPFQLYSQNK